MKKDINIDGEGNIYLQLDIEITYRIILIV